MTHDFACTSGFIMCSVPAVLDRTEARRVDMRTVV